MPFPDHGARFPSGERAHGTPHVATTFSSSGSGRWARRRPYVPLLRRAYEGWHEFAQASGRDLLRLCGGIYIGDPESPVFIGSLASARVHGLEHEVLDAAEIAARFPTTWQRPAPADHPRLVERGIGQRCTGSRTAHANSSTPLLYFGPLSCLRLAKIALTRADSGAKGVLFQDIGNTCRKT
jgi:hypothetical protein